MSTTAARRLLLERLGAGETSLLALHFELPSFPGWADGLEAAGRSVLLVGAHALRPMG